ncbi:MULTISPECIES: DUF3054 domain-containing protein [Microbacterium]|uniref:DUF3054 domain-containing protein n=1 Tax=Microbacterium wangchenii TaxID=2541726 RepID=A0ABX5STG9_9MICO|nr:MULTISPECIES: DUF3054 domain-containing protein [Microbacterium]MCK6065038.1 DUF3054 domain-containing protein [Microbacterium sp. EYE_512]QBR88506.1 DUF3054 domain-containing protein [Microbacterium wangchenii]TXK20233.1 DUF3054 domain-containing protein [Microbacterium wangchenii]
MSTRRAALGAFALDAVLVTVFAAIGRATHEGDPFGPGGSGLAQTAWPFLVSLLAGWLIAVAWRRPAAAVRTGVPVWAITVAGGMLLRAVSGQGTAVAFIVVATVTLLAFLVGWRAIAAGVARLRRRDRHAASARAAG